MQIWIFSSALAMMVTASVHLFAGGRFIVKPFLATDMDETVKYTLYYCWHGVTIILYAWAGWLVWLSFQAGGWIDTALTFSAILATIAAIFSFYFGYAWVKNVRKMPQWALFAPVAILNIVGILSVQ